jgi:hypothetical protein
MKKLAVVISGLPAEKNFREIEVQPGSTAGDVLRALSLTGYLLSREGSAQAFANEEEIYPVVESGSKLRATPIAEVGRKGWVEKLLRWLGLEKVFGRRVRVRGTTRPAPPGTPSTALLAPGGRIQVRADRRPLWETRCWRQRGRWLVGAFRTPLGSVAGEIFTEGEIPEFYIINPPKALLSGGHGACFRWRRPGRYFVHFASFSPDIDAGIVAVEKLIVAALKQG